MKVRFKKDYSYPWIWSPLVGLLLLIAAFFVFGDAKLWDLVIFMGLIFPVAISLIPYRLTDNNTLIGNGVINISFIYQLEKKDKGVKVYYTWAVNGIPRDRFFAVKDKDFFISTLLEINPNIKLN